MPVTYYRLGLWNSAGAVVKTFKTKEERNRFRLEATRTGYICWEEGTYVDPR